MSLTAVRDSPDISLLSAVRDTPDIKIVLKEDKSLNKEFGRAFRHVVKRECEESYREFLTSIISVTFENLHTGVIRFNRIFRPAYYFCMTEKMRYELSLTLYDKLKQKLLLRKVAHAALNSLCNGQMSRKVFWPGILKDYIFARLNKPDEKLVEFLASHGVCNMFLTESDTFVVTFTEDGEEFDIDDLMGIILLEKASPLGSSS